MLGCARQAGRQTYHDFPAAAAAVQLWHTHEGAAQQPHQPLATARLSTPTPTALPGLPAALLCAQQCRPDGAGCAWHEARGVPVPGGRGGWGQPGRHFTVKGAGGGGGAGPCIRGPLDPGTLEPLDPGTLEPWNPGTLEPWNPGTLEPWNPSTLEPWNPGTLEPLDPGTWNPRTLEPWNPWTLEPLDPGTLGPLDPGTLEP